MILIKEMIDIFISQVPEFITEMKEHYEQGNYEMLGAVAHKAKSSVTVMGMDDLGKNLKSLELLAKAGEEKEKYPGFIEEFIEQTTTSVKELEEYAGNL